MVDTIESTAPADPGNPSEATSEQTAAVIEKPADAQTILTNPGDQPVVGDWPEDWRDKLTKDEKLRQRLDRFKSPGDVLKAYTEIEKKMSAGEKAKLAADATPEQVTAWRKDNGIPEKPDGYLENLPKGLVIGDDDKPRLNAYLERVHGKNASPEIVADTLDWYYAEQESAIAAQAEKDTEYRQKSVEELRAEWGTEFKANVNSVKAFVASAPVAEDGTKLGDLLMGARLADGTMLGDNPAALRWLAKLADDANPAGFIAPSAGTSQKEGVESEIASIEKTMRENRPAYDKDERMQKRLLQLYEAQEKLSAR